METLPEQDQTEPVEPTPPASGRRRPGSLAILAGAVAVIIVAALVLSLIEMGSANSRADRLQRLDNLRTSATKAADSYGVDFGSYNYQSLHGASAPWTLIEAHSTARFRSDYQKTSAALEPTIVAYKASAQATIPVSAVTSISSSRAVVLLVLRQTITNSTQKSGAQTQQFVVIMTLLRQKGQWLIDDVQASV
jgi:Mce-associated membrane protein